MFKLGNTEVNATAVTENYESVVPDQIVIEDWVKPSTWLDPPANPNGDDVIYGILPVYDTDQEEVIITFYFGNNNDSGGSVDVDWGDGNVETFTATNPLPREYCCKSGPRASIIIFVVSISAFLEISKSRSPGRMFFFRIDRAKFPHRVFSRIKLISSSSLILRILGIRSEMFKILQFNNSDSRGPE